MQASPAKVIDYFNGEKQNLIPLFQRPYTWDAEKWKTLWDDVMVQYDIGESENSSHFMGAIVSVPAKSVPVGVSKFLIIDGQQRLTTVTLLLCALRDCLDANSAARIQQVYLTNQFRDAEDTLKFVPTQVDREAYRKLVLDRQISSSGRLSEAYRYFHGLLKEGIDANGDAVVAAKVLTTLEHCLQVVMINLGESDDPYLIFESLNFKGSPLNQADLVRNYVLMRFRHSVASGGEQERVYSRFWEPLEKLLGENLTEFLRHYAMKDGENIKQGGIYAATKNRLKDIETSEAVEAEVSRMLSFGLIYANLIDPAKETSTLIRARLENINDLEVSTSYPLLLRLFDTWKAGKLTETDLERCLELVEAFVVRRAVCGVATHALNKMFLQWSRNFPESNHLLWLHTSISSGGRGRRFPSDSEFAEAFMNQPQYGRGATRFILCRLELALEHKEAVDLATTTIEHVLPQTLTETWEKELGVGAKELHVKLLDTFGNLTLTGYNVEMGNLPFAEKKERMSNTHIEMNRWILAQANWRQDEISTRAKDMQVRAAQLWPGPIPVAQEED